MKKIIIAAAAIVMAASCANNKAAAPALTKSGIDPQNFVSEYNGQPTAR